MQLSLKKDALACRGEERHCCVCRHRDRRQSGECNCARTRQRQPRRQARIDVRWRRPPLRRRCVEQRSNASSRLLAPRPAFARTEQRAPWSNSCGLLCFALLFSSPVARQVSAQCSSLIASPAKIQPMWGRWSKAGAARAGRSAASRAATVAVAAAPRCSLFPLPAALRHPVQLQWRAMSSAVETSTVAATVVISPVDPAAAAAAAPVDDGSAAVRAELDSVVLQAEARRRNRREFRQRKAAQAREQRDKEMEALALEANASAAATLAATAAANADKVFTYTPPVNPTVPKWARKSMSPASAAAALGSDLSSAGSAAIVPAPFTPAEEAEALAWLAAWDAMNAADRLAQDASFVPTLFFSLLRVGQPVPAWRVHGEFDGLLAGSGAGWSLSLVRSWLSAFQDHAHPLHSQEAERVWLRMAQAGLQNAADAGLYRSMIEIYLADGRPDKLDKIEAFWNEVQSKPHLRFTTEDYEALITHARECGHRGQVQLWCSRARIAGVWELLSEQTRFAELLQVREGLLEELRFLSIRTVNRFPATAWDRALTRDPEWLKLQRAAKDLFFKLTRFSMQKIMLSQPFSWTEVEQLLDSIRNHQIYTQAMQLTTVIRKQQMFAVEKERRRLQVERNQQRKEQLAMKQAAAAAGDAATTEAGAAETETPKSDEQGTAAAVETSDNNAAPTPVAAAGAAEPATVPTAASPVVSSSPPSSLGLGVDLWSLPSEAAPSVPALAFEERMPAGLVADLFGLVLRAHEAQNQGLGASEQDPRALENAMENARATLEDLVGAAGAGAGAGGSDMKGRVQLTKGGSMLAELLAKYPVGGEDSAQLPVASFRSIYDALPASARDAATHAAMLSMYSRCGMVGEVEALYKLLELRPVEAGGDADTVALVFASMIAHINKAELATQAAILQRAERMWGLCKSHLPHMLNEQVTGHMVKLYQAVGDLQRIQSIIAEALQLEQQQDAGSSSSSSGARTCFVGYESFASLLESWSLSSSPATHQVDSAHVFGLLQSRFVASSPSARHENLASLRGALDAFAKLERAISGMSLLGRWRALSRIDKERNPLLLLAVLVCEFNAPNVTSMAQQPNAAEAARIVEAELAWLGRSPIAVDLFHAWLSCYQRTGDWQGAERVCERMLESHIAPTSFTYRTLMEVYMRSDSSEQVEMIEKLYTEMRSGTGPAGRLSMQPTDFAHLMHTAQAMGMEQEKKKWAGRAKTADVWPQTVESLQQVQRKAKPAAAARDRAAATAVV